MAVRLIVVRLTAPRLTALALRLTPAPDARA
jgi:hypothetical protein